MCWWQVWDVGDRYHSLRKSPTSQISHHHKVTNITTSPTSLSPIFLKQQKDFTLDNFRNNLQFQIHFEWSSKMPFSKFKIKCLPKISSSAYNISRFNKLNFDLHRSVIKLLYNPNYVGPTYFSSWSTVFLGFIILKNFLNFL